jgi:hypothetical protein
MVSGLTNRSGQGFSALAFLIASCEWRHGCMIVIGWINDRLLPSAAEGNVMHH